MPVRGRRLVAETAALATAYFVAGRAALLLAIPPGYATPVWPAAGIAAGVLLTRGRALWPGILAGSFAVNVGTSFDTSSPGSIALSLAVAAGIAGGAALQAVMAVILVERAVGWPDPLHGSGAIARFVALTGPAACAVNGVLAPAILFAGNRIEGNEIPYSVFTWWAGDTIGVLIATPLVLTLLAAPRDAWRRRLPAVVVPMATTLLLVFMSFALARMWERQRIRSEFLRRASVQQQSLRRALDGHIEALVSVGALFRASEQVSPAEFKTFVEHGVLRHAGLQAVSWVPRVPAATPADDAAIRALDGTGITELLASGALGPAQPRAEHFPIAFIEPPPGNEPALGFDLASDPVRRRALEEAAATDRTCATAPLHLVQERGEAPGFLLAFPVRMADAAGADGPLRGFATAAFRVQDLLNAALEGVDRAGIALEIRDVSDEGPGAPLVPARPDPPPARNGGVRSTDDVAGEIPESVVEEDVGGRRWRIRFSPKREFLTRHQTWHAWMVLAGGFVFTGLFGAFLLLVTGRAGADAERNARLAEIVAELARSNADLGNFAYVASHDLQEPLRKVHAFGEILRTRYAAALPPDALGLLERMEGAALRMRSLITGLLEYSRVTNHGHPFTEVDLGERAAAALADLDQLVASTGGDVRIGRLPRIRADAGQMQRLFQNLLANALKFHRPGVAPSVVVRAEPDPGGGSAKASPAVRILVEDNGIGVAPEHRERIFLPFQRLHGRAEYEGTGMGLAICRRIVERHGGTIRVDGAPGGGSVFVVTLPAADASASV